MFSADLTSCLAQSEPSNQMSSAGLTSRFAHMYGLFWRGAVLMPRTMSKRSRSSVFLHPLIHALHSSVTTPLLLTRTLANIAPPWQMSLESTFTHRS